MRRLCFSGSRRNRAVLIGGLMVLFLGILPQADAKTRARRKPATFAVALQPFSLVQSAVDAVAAPVIYNAPRVFSAAASVHPIHVAYYAPRIRRPAPPRPPRAQPADEERDEANQPPDADTNFMLAGGSHPTVGGSRAVLRGGVAYAPANAPANVKNAIWAANALRHKPYVWGGGHGSFQDYGYDCSGTVSFALHHAGLLSAPIPSSDFMRYGERGRGRWITVYSRPGHTFAVIAGLRLDTTDFRSGGNVGPRWHEDGRETWGFDARHPARL